MKRAKNAKKNPKEYADEVMNILGNLSDTEAGSIFEKRFLMEKMQKGRSEGLKYAKKQGWIEEFEDEYGLTKYKITNTGAQEM